SSAGVSWVIILGLALSLYSCYAWAGSRLIWTSKHYFAGGAGIVTGLLSVVAVMARSDPAKIGNLVCAVIGVIILIFSYKRS
ncbi:MAG: hypothetical protein HXS54_09975, partial [Theionarchaea archaeon]|nr:hypothetical protein [Theionarchaea archaeon]